MTHRFPVRVYYEDTDMAGIVYYANYLRYIERARSDWVRDMGLDQRVMKEQGAVFVVRRVVADYLAPAHFDDALSVETGVTQVGRARMVLMQRVLRDEAAIFTAEVTIVCVGAEGKPMRLPAIMRHHAGVAPQ